MNNFKFLNNDLIVSLSRLSTFSVHNRRTWLDEKYSSLNASVACLSRDADISSVSLIPALGYLSINRLVILLVVNDDNVKLNKINIEYNGIRVLGATISYSYLIDKKFKNNTYWDWDVRENEVLYIFRGIP